MKSIRPNSLIKILTLIMLTKKRPGIIPGLKLIINAIPSSMVSDGHRQDKSLRSKPIS